MRSSEISFLLLYGNLPLMLLDHVKVIHLFIHSLREKDCYQKWNLKNMNEWVNNNQVLHIELIYVFIYIEPVTFIYFYYYIPENSRCFYNDVYRNDTCNSLKMNSLLWVTISIYREKIIIAKKEEQVNRQSLVGTNSHGHWHEK